MQQAQYSATAEKKGFQWEQHIRAKVPFFETSALPHMNKAGQSSLRDRAQSAAV